MFDVKMMLEARRTSDEVENSALGQALADMALFKMTVMLFGKEFEQPDLKETELVAILAGVSAVVDSTVAALPERAQEAIKALKNTISITTVSIRRPNNER